MANKYHQPHGPGWPISGKEATKKRKKQQADKNKERTELPSPPAWQGFRNE